MAQAPDPKTHGHGEETTSESRVSARAFLRLEHIVYLVLGGLLALTVVVALMGVAIALFGAARSLGASEEVIVTIDRLLFVLMLVEILHTVRVSMRSGILTCEPFLVVGLIASIRRVLVITLSSSEATHAGNWTPDVKEQFNATMTELAVLALLILVMVFAIYLLRRQQPSEGSGIEAGESGNAD